MRISNSSVLFVFLFISFQFSQSQEKCGGSEMYAQKDCSGDDAVRSETELFRLVNEYRKQNGLAEVSDSKTLYRIANRDLIDISLYWKKLTNSRSDCNFDYNISPKIPVTAVHIEIIYDLSVDENNFLNLLVRPKAKVAAIEIR